MTDPHGPAPRLTGTQWLICILAAIGFAFDIYELLMLPLIVGPAIQEILGKSLGSPEFLYWRSMLFYVPAICGGIFGMLGGYLTDIFGRRRVLTWSILLYAISAFLAGFSTSMEMLLVLRCFTFVGFCIEFVAAVAWLSELFSHPKQREQVLGYTQAFSSFGGLMVAGVFALCVQYANQLPAIWLPDGWAPAGFNPHAGWRYTLMSGLLPAIPLILIRPFLPESPAWAEKKAKGTLRRPSFVELFQPALARTTIMSTLMMACVYGTALGAIQALPQIVPGTPDVAAKVAAKREEMEKKGAKEAEIKQAEGKIKSLAVKDVSVAQEIGGLVGRFLLAVLVVLIASRQNLLRVFLGPGIFLVPLFFAFSASMGLYSLMAGAFIAGLFTVAQFSFWGNYLPRVYPLHLRGTGESFAANVGGRLIGTSAAVVTGYLAAEVARWMSTTQVTHVHYAYSAAIIALTTYFVGNILCFFLPEPAKEELPE